MAENMMRQVPGKFTPTSPNGISDARPVRFFRARFGLFFFLLSPRAAVEESISLPDLFAPVPEDSPLPMATAGGLPLEDEEGEQDGACPSDAITTKDLFATAAGRTWLVDEDDGE